MTRRVLLKNMFLYCVYCVDMCALTTYQQADVTAVLTPAACQQSTSSGDSPVQMCSVQNISQINSVSAQTIKPPSVAATASAVYLVERRQVVSGLDEEGLVDSGMVHVVGGCCHQTQEHIQRAQLLCQLQHREHRH